MCGETRKGMSDQKKEKISILMILILVLLMITFIFVQAVVFDFFELKAVTLNLKETTNWGKLEDIKSSKGMYEVLKSNFNPPNFIDRSVKQRTLEEFYSLRAYHGAPPVIPHPIAKSKSLSGDSCLGCHKMGGYTPKFNAYAPVVPHPEKMNCRQCHNPRNQETLFKETEWSQKKHTRGFSHLPSSPLVIPHSIQMRENCLSCHSGPAAIKEVRTTHPERINCMQCHVRQRTSNLWEKK